VVTGRTVSFSGRAVGPRGPAALPLNKYPFHTRDPAPTPLPPCACPLLHFRECQAHCFDLRGCRGFDAMRSPGLVRGEQASNAIAGAHALQVETGSAKTIQQTVHGSPVELGILRLPCLRYAEFLRGRNAQGSWPGNGYGGWYRGRFVRLLAAYDSRGRCLLLSNRRA
jgi:hypothetical protein